MKKLLQEIKTELGKICPEHVAEKEKYGTKEAIRKFEQENGLKFPEELVTFWLECDFAIYLDTKIYQTLKLKEADRALYFSMDSFKFLVGQWEDRSGDDITENFRSWDYYTLKGRGFAEGIMEEAIFDRAWFPIAEEDDGSLIVVDMKPGPNGVYGQILYMMSVSEGRSGPYYSGYNSLHELLSNYLKDLKEGRYLVEEDRVYPLVYKNDPHTPPVEAPENKFQLVLDELQALHKELAPDQLNLLAIEPATDEDIAALEAMVMDKLPEDFVTWLKYQHFMLQFDDDYISFTVREVINHLKYMNELLANGTFDDGRVAFHEKEGFGNWDGDFLKKVWWSPKWIPFAQDHLGNMKCIDLDPGSRGRKGQLIEMEVLHDQGPYKDQYHVSFSTYIKYNLNLIKKGQYTLDSHWEGRWKGGRLLHIQSKKESTE